MELFKLIPYIWPTIRELIVGGKDHPYFKDRSAIKPAKVIAWLFFILVIILGDLAYILYKENTLLTEQLAAAKLESGKKSFTYEDYANWKVCNANLTFSNIQKEELVVDIKEAESEIKSLRQDIEYLNELLRLCREHSPKTPTLPKPKSNISSKLKDLDKDMLNEN
jgi:hypothetical protein